jgi:dimethylglycine catabolism B
LDLAYLLLYFISIATVGAIFYAVLAISRRSGTSLKPGRLLGLSMDEARRLRTGDSVFLMHLSIALGVGLSIACQILDPAFAFVPLLGSVLTWVSLPLIVGLLGAFVWRIQRFQGSKKVEKDLRTTSQFSSKSSVLQAVLIAAIALTTSELVVLWFPAYILLGWVLGIARNSLIAVYYTKPSVNLIRGFDSPLYGVKTPFKLEDVVSGKTDASDLKIGVSGANEFSADERLSIDSCVEIGACESACPATAAGRPLSPRVLVRKLSLMGTGAQGPGPDPFSTVLEDELWSCTSCGACVSSCPVAVNHLDVIYDLRRTLVAKGSLDKEKSAMLENLGRQQNPYGFRQADRAKWADGLEVPTLASAPDSEYVYWVGCISSFDQRAQRIARSLAKILKQAGVTFAILGPEELCTGDPARRLGEEGRYQELAYQNIQTLKSHQVKKLVASCPHCYNALKNEYPQFGGIFEVVYHTQLISDLIRDGRIRVSRQKVGEISATLHDACYATRYNNVFDEPRRALEASGARLKEMGRHGEKTFCCGAGGSNYWFKVPSQRSIAGIRTEEASHTGAKTIATECPFCLSMLDDTTKVMGTGMDVRDVAEIVAESLS